MIIVLKCYIFLLWVSKVLSLISADRTVLIYIIVLNLMLVNMPLNSKRCSAFKVFGHFQSVW